MVNDKLIDYKKVDKGVIAGNLPSMKTASCSLDCVYGSCIAIGGYPDSCICLEGFKGAIDYFSVDLNIILFRFKTIFT